VGTGKSATFLKSRPEYFTSFRPAKSGFRALKKDTVRLKTSPPPVQPTSNIVRLERYASIAALVWTAVILASFAWNVVSSREDLLKSAQQQIRFAYEKDVLYEEWNAQQGGVYVPATEETPPNPYLAMLPERDIITPSGRVLTLLNPTAMTIKANEIAQREALGNTNTRITSLSPLNPHHVPDSWETDALEAFERGEKEVSAVVRMQGKKSLRLMRPFVAEEKCLTCHGGQGLKGGDIRGGISVSVPLEPLLASERERWRWLGIVHGLLWLTGLTGIAVARSRVRRSERERETVEESLLTSEERYRTLVENVNVGIYRGAADQDGTLIQANPSMVRLLGYEGWDELKQVPFSVHFEAPEKLQEFFAQIEEKGSVKDFETQLRRRDGSSLCAALTAGAHYGEEGTIAWIDGTVEDVTERTQAQMRVQQAHEKLSLWVRELEEKNQEINLLAQMGEFLQACRTTAEAYQVIAQSAPQLFPQESGGFYVLNPSRNLLEAVAQWGALAPEEQVFVPEECWALRFGRMHVVEKKDTDLMCPHVSASTPPYLCVPMLAHGEMVGILHITRPEAPGQDSEVQRLQSKRQLISSVAKQVGMALSNLRLRETLRNLSIRDPLTNLFNRRYMEESLERELVRASRKDSGLGIIMIDLDHFKRFNDAFGHEAGDVLLRNFGAFLQRNIRGSDIACRYGGEEFTVIMPEASLETTCHRAEHLRAGVQEVSVGEGAHRLGEITISLGVAVSPDHGASSGSLLQAADAALYRAKKSGRDRVCFAGEEVRGGSPTARG
jgi:diguanylate cyclase (GGDEF)-like protein/PAS domain S-box-containing protein